MSYTEQFSGQWDIFIVNFRSDIEKLPVEAITLKEIKKWYRTNSFRWSSIIETEGMLLDQENNAQLKNELIAAIDSFDFREAESTSKKPSALPFLCIGVALAAAAVFLGRAGKFLPQIAFLVKIYTHLPLWLLLLIAILCFMLPLVFFAVRLDKYIKDSPRKLCDQYVLQLRNYKETLIDICRRFE